MYQEESDLLLISDEEEGERLDKVLATRFRDRYSRTYFQYLIEERLVLVNGTPAKKRLKLSPGDEIEVQFASLPEIDLTPENISLDILYEDDDLIAVNKPAGMVTHPAPGNWSGTFVNALLFHCQGLINHGGSLRPGIVHRLDKDTSGVLVAAKTLEAQQKLIELFASRQVYKEYLGICLGHPPEGEMREPIGRHPVQRKKMAVVPTGKPAITHIKNLGWDGKLTVVRAVIQTGRTHQIRVHLQHKGCPILGDALYGQSSANQKYKVERQLLHAAVVQFIHPMSGKELKIEAPLPEDFSTLMRTILHRSTALGGN